MTALDWFAGSASYHVTASTLAETRLRLQVYEIVALIDQRERFDAGPHGAAGAIKQTFEKHLEHLRDAGLRVEARHLAIGDIAWVCKCVRRVEGGPEMGARSEA